MRDLAEISVEDLFKEGDVAVANRLGPWLSPNLPL